MIEELNEYIEQRRAIDEIYTNVETFTQNDQRQMIDKFKDLPDAMINVVIEYLQYFKFDYVTKSLKVYHHQEDIAFRSGAISSIDAMILILEQTKKERPFVNRITGERQQTKSLEKGPQE